MIKRFTAAAALFGLAIVPFCFSVTAPDKATDGELPQLASTPLMQNEAKLIVEMLETMHFESAEISNASFYELITHYMEALDYNKLFYLSEHEEHFQKKYGDILGFKLRYQGDLESAFEIYTLYRDRVIDRVDWILQQLEKDWSFDEDEYFIYDRSESPWPSSEEEADELWRLRIKYELLQEILNDKTQEEAKERITKRYKRVLRSIYESGSKDVQEIFLTSLTKMFDPHSSFLSSDTLEDFNISMRLKLIGIGAMLSEEDGYCVIRELVPGAPAIRSKKLSPNDRIVAVAQEGEEPVDIIGMGLRKIVDQIRGEKGTKVTLTIIPSDATDDSVREDVVIVRDEVHINSSRATGKIFDVPDGKGGNSPIGVIDIPTFYGGDEYIENGQRYTTSVTADVEELVLKMKAEGVQGIVLDLRRNGGGLLDEAIKMTGLFIRRGPVVQVREKSGYVVSHMDRDPKVAYSGPLAVLTSRYSASASEILAGALQNYGRSITIGNSSTHGKGTVQQVFSLDQYVLRKELANDRAGAAKLTIRKFYLPNGFSTQRKGVVPDIQLHSMEEVTAVGEADLPESLSWDYIKPVARFVEMTLKNSLLETLTMNSEQRAETLEEFSFLQKRLDWFAEREERKQISLNLEQRKIMMEQDEAFLDAIKEEQRKLAEKNYEFTEVKLDSVVREEAQRKLEEEEYEATQAAKEIDAPTEETTGTSDVAVADQKEAVEDEEEEDLPEFDIQLRETLRIMTEAIEISPNPVDWSQPALPIASKSRFERLLN
ncbi:carboxy terminal-processing peptidase [Pelagicoccus sp. NFK12]|uniref:Carboxy terminal-processing peptidase n=1 Tax=Pelagicoccus enzymogenes TaxID=2773457 RepID=A0A927F9Q5_9BACT|nr:carboxy terminal-processing peptidase [Pelagicoccus enzymogenes]MBD5779493.1 carboxy terminal-processing peptidase [Pelagicoccus enzymogenes]MDQ8201006.1 carboxy terminal-processing peptidase [Pelagicoccus enzymogenes]